MAFTSAEATKIRHYLGYPQVYRQSNPRLESAIVVVGGDADAVTLVQGILVSVEAALAAINGKGLDSAGVKALDKGDVELYQGGAIRDPKEVGRTAVAQLSTTFGVPIANDVFGTGGYSGDAWKGQNARTSLAGLS